MLFSFLNMVGYDVENRTAGMSPVRKKVRDVLLGYRWNGKYPHLVRATRTNHPWHLLKVIFAKPKTIRSDSTLSSFISDFRKFSQEPLVRKLWGVLKAHQAKEARKLFPLFARETARLIVFTSWPPREVKKIVLIANPLDAYWSGYELKIGGIGYIVVGPGAETNQGELIRHELLHLLAPRIRIKQWIPSRDVKRLAAIGYVGRRLINREYVVRGLNFIYESEVLKKDITRDIKREEKDFPHIREVVNHLSHFIKIGPYRGPSLRREEPSSKAL